MITFEIVPLNVNKLFPTIFFNFLIRFLFVFMIYFAKTHHLSSSVSNHWKNTDGLRRKNKSLFLHEKRETQSYQSKLGFRCGLRK
jgi:hypothetical protein